MCSPFSHDGQLLPPLHSFCLREPGTTACRIFRSPRQPTHYLDHSTRASLHRLQITSTRLYYPSPSRFQRSTQTLHRHIQHRYRQQLVNGTWEPRVLFSPQDKLMIYDHKETKRTKKNDLVISTDTAASNGIWSTWARPGSAHTRTCSIFPSSRCVNNSIGNILTNVPSPRIFQWQRLEK